MFSERLEEMITALGIKSSSELARRIGCDRSMISKMRNGKLRCDPEGEFAVRLVDGLYECGVARETLAEAASIAGADPEGVKPILCARIFDHLFEGEEMSRSKRRQKRRSDSVFSELLNAVIAMASISNSSLAKLSNVDPSIISRYRNGKRIPVSGSAILESICRVLTVRIYKNGRAGDLASFLSYDTVPEPDEACAELIRRLCETEPEDKKRVAGLVRDISSFIPAENPEPVSDTIAPDESKSVYFGTEGLKEAVLRFLADAVRSGVRELLLYSDLSMSWMIDDRDFAKKWSTLLLECINAGIRIRVIHNIDRSVEEMTGAIRAWIPLYMTGAVTSTCSLLSAGRRFMHTFFLAPEHACISSFSPRDMADSAVYRYDTEQDALELHRRMFDGLLRGNLNLVRVTRAADDDDGNDGVRVMFSDDEVIVRRLSEPRMDFHISHPLMRNAFEAYLS